MRVMRWFYAAALLVSLTACSDDECRASSECGGGRCVAGKCEARPPAIPPGEVDGGFYDAVPFRDAFEDAEAGLEVGVEPVFGPDGGDAAIDAGTIPWPPPGYARIEPGTFLRGSAPSELDRDLDEGPQRSITISRAFYIKTTEVTAAEFRAVMRFDPSAYVDCGDDCPVNTTSWDLAVRYVNALSMLAGTTSCYTANGTSWDFAGPSCDGYRLPTEAEWEYAARAGSVLPLSNGVLAQPLCAPPDRTLDRVGWFCGNSTSTVMGCVDLSAQRGPSCAGPQPVAMKEANAFGLYDVHGNVLEWVHDRYDANYYAMADATDPTGPTTGATRVLRGGSWLSLGGDCRSAARDFEPEDAALQFVGFRPAVTAR